MKGLIFLRICRLFLLMMLCSVLCLGLFLVPSYAATIEQYSYNGVVLPKLPDTKPIFYICELDGKYYAVGMTSQWTSGIAITLSSAYVVEGNEWVFKTFDEVIPSVPIFWSAHDISIDGKVYVAGSQPVVTVIEIPDPPPSVGDVLSAVGEIFTSAVSWVSDVGAAILAQPLLLAFTALPLCGLGIAVFRRLKETV